MKNVCKKGVKRQNRRTIQDMFMNHKKTYKTTNRLKIKYRIRKIIKHCRNKQKTDSNERHIKERMK